MARRKYKPGPWVQLAGSRARTISDVLPKREYKGKRYIQLTRHMIDAGRSDVGQFNRRQLAILGVTYPLPKGWVRDLIGKPIAVADYEAFLAAGLQ